MDVLFYSPGGGAPLHTTKTTLEETLALCSAIEVPRSASPDLPAVPAARRRSQRLLGRSPPLATVFPTPGQRRIPRSNPKSFVLAPKKEPSRARKCNSRPCKLCKGKEKAGPTLPVRIRLGITSKFRFTDDSGVAHLRMGFRYLMEDQEWDGKTTMVLALGMDIVGAEIAGLDTMDVDVRLGFAVG